MADLLRGSFKAHQYGDIILPFTVLRRLDCVLAPTKGAVLDAVKTARAEGLPGYAVGAPTAGYYWPSATIREFIAICWDHRWLNGAMLTLACLPLIAYIWASLG